MQQLFFRSRALRGTALPCYRASHAYLRARASLHDLDYSYRMISPLLAVPSHGNVSSVLGCSCRFMSSSTWQGSPKASSKKQKYSFTDNDVKTSSNTPKWVSTCNQSGAKRMSVSIRSSAQRQRARRTLPASSDLSFVEVRQTGEGTAQPTEAGVQHSSTKSPANVRSSDDVGPQKISSTSLSLDDCAMEAPSKGSSPSAAPFSNSGCGAASASNHHAAPPTATPTPTSKAEESPAEMPAVPKNVAVSAPDSGSSVPYSPPHPLLYSLSRFTEPVKRIILIRNGRSEANEDVATYVRTPDWRIPLVEEGKHESIAAGRALSELVGDEPVHFYYSPYIRSRQSLRYILQGYDEVRLNGPSRTQEWCEEEDDWDSASVAPSHGEGGTIGEQLLQAAGASTASAAAAGSCAGVRDAVSNDPTSGPGPTLLLKKDPSLVLNRGTSDSIIGVREDVRLRDGDIGRYINVEELMYHLQERERYGKFFYRFPYGESGADVCDRVTSFLDAFQRERVGFPMNTNVVIITHGLTMRMLIKRWFHLTVDTFHRMRSPPPGSLCTLTRLHHRSCFRLDESCVELMHLPLSLNKYNGYKYRNKQLLGSMSSGAPYM
ncbi:phosphoglycerate mutase putative (iPGAM) [Leptomonas seymouri]|uniref:Phosphoglycerate mutase putative (IPGAM) n=1 Tax=Leptomonas seymouri TaxID=5684 RepID=A0A0N1HZZ8_LEPSE|nr:phosphoglycerate mutase putative (iPGAM) [Leptomonas seymouri]|eukprot:KPI83144.1 phosphoglycerate mutase putative (iPGAM) [Leptomonas seymouri]